jgi:dTDP-4-amino-4,6-dideoxygalactose transaminase
LRLLRSHGMTTLTWDRHKGRAWSYDVVELGYNYRIDEIRAALGLVQLNKLEHNNAQRRYLTLVYQDALQERVPELTIPFQHYRGVSAAHIMPILLPASVNRIHFMEGMKSQGIQTSIHYPPVHGFTAYKGKVDASALPHTEDATAREVTLPLYPMLSEADVIIIAQVVSQTLAAMKELS